MVFIVFVWRGFGFVVPLIACVVFVSTQFAIDAAMGDDYYTANGWPKFVACSAVAMVLLPVGLWMNRSTSGTQVGSVHTFFFIPVQYWSAIVFLFGIYMAFRP